MVLFVGRYREQVIGRLAPGYARSLRRNTSCWPVKVQLPWQTVVHQVNRLSLSFPAYAVAFLSGLNELQISRPSALHSDF